MEIKIGKRKIGPGHPCYLIAEAGVNHDCILERGYQLIDQAKRAGADAIKFQAYKAEKLVTTDAPKYWSRDEQTQYENYKKLDKFGYQEYLKLKERCDKKGITFLCTPFDSESVELLEKLKVWAYKIASADITNFPLLEKVAKINKPIFLSTGAATIGEIKSAVRLIESYGNHQILLLHCILCYPTPVEQANLKWIEKMRSEFPGHIIGVSDHTTGIVPAIAAAALGAKVVEKHYTIDKAIKGSSDHPISIDPEELKQMVESIRIAEKTLGSPDIHRPLEIEKPAYTLARRSLAALKRIDKGERFTPENIAFLRPGTGISPKEVKKVLGRQAKQDIEENRVIRWDMVE